MIAVNQSSQFSDDRSFESEEIDTIKFRVREPVSEQNNPRFTTNPSEYIPQSFSKLQEDNLKLQEVNERLLRENNRLEQNAQHMLLVSTRLQESALRLRDDRFKSDDEVLRVREALLSAELDIELMRIISKQLRAEIPGLEVPGFEELYGIQRKTQTERDLWSKEYLGVLL